MTGKGPDTLPVGSIRAIARQCQRNTAKSCKSAAPHAPERHVAVPERLADGRLRLASLPHLSGKTQQYQ
jgi:hypothetical protein